MLLEMAVLMAVLFMGFEIYCVVKFPRLGKIIESKAGLSLAFSLGLSYFVEVLFPASGIILMIAAIMSTIMIQPFYAMRRDWEKIMAWKARTTTSVKAPFIKIGRAVKLGYNWVFHPIQSIRNN